MSIAVPLLPTAERPAPSRASDFLELTKPRIAAMALVTVAVGYLLGAAEFGPSSARRWSRPAGAR